MKYYEQCGEVHVGVNGRVLSARFCVRPRGHAGDHRAGGRQWTQDGVRVSPPTIDLNAAMREDPPLATLGDVMKQEDK